MNTLQKIFWIFMVSIFMLASSSCEKDKDETSLTKEQILLSHLWKWNKMTTTSTNEDLQSLVTLMSALMTGATLDFNEDGSYTMTILNDSEDGTWDLPNDATLIMDTDEMNIVKLTDAELVMGGEEVDDDYGTYSVTMYWKK